MPARISDVGTVGEHAAISQRDVIASTDAATRTHQTRIAESNAAVPRLASPNTNLYSLTGGVNRGERVADADVGPRDIDIPRRHDGRVSTKVDTSGSHEPVDPGCAEGEVGTFDPKRAEIFAHAFSIDRTVSGSGV